MTERNLKNTYDIWSKTYDETENPLIDIEEGVVKSLLDTIEFRDVLDAASGTGRYAIYLAQQGKQVAAVDSNENMLAEAQKKAQAMQLQIDFRQEDISNLSFEDSSFDLVICALSLAHVKDLTKPCHEFIRVIRPGGYLIISDLHPQIQELFDEFSEFIEGEGPLFLPNYHSRVDDYLEAVTNAGAEILNVRNISELEISGNKMPGALLIWARKPSEVGD